MIDDVLSKLEKVRKHGNYWTARCPAHDDKRASLSISEGETGVLLKCHAGCDIKDIAGRIGLDLKDLFYESSSGHGQEPEAVYTYVDEQGTPLFEVVRFPGKTFRQRTPDGEWSIRGVRRVLYRLPEVLGAPAANKVVWIVEGEKDVEALRKLGSIATCNMGGAGAWKPEYNESLRGAHVYIVVDKDDAGRKHAEEVSRQLEGIAASVKLVQAARGKDASDHIAAGLGLEDFEPFAPETGLVLVNFSDVKAEDVHWIEGFQNELAYGLLTLLTGMPGANKTTWATMAAAMVTRLGQNVMMASAEDSYAVLRGRLQAHGGNPNLMNGAAMRRDGVDGGLVLLPTDVPALVRTIERRRIKLLIVDPIQAHYSPGHSANSDQDVRMALAPLAYAAAQLGCAVLVLNHLTKGKERDPYIRAGGSIGLPGISRVCLLMAEHPEDRHDGDRRVVVGFKNSNGPKARAVEYRIEMAAVDGYTVPPIRLTRVGEVYMSPSRLLGAAAEQGDG